MMTNKEREAIRTALAAKGVSRPEKHRHQWRVRWRVRIKEGATIKRKWCTRTVGPHNGKATPSDAVLLAAKQIADDLPSKEELRTGQVRAIRLAEFAEQHWLPWVSKFKKRASFLTYRRIWKQFAQVIPAKVMLTDVTGPMAQGWLTALIETDRGRGRKISVITARNWRTVLTGIFAAAAKLGFVPANRPNPASKLSLPRGLTPKIPLAERGYYTLPEIAGIVRLLDMEAAATEGDEKRNLLMAATLCMVAGLAPAERRTARAQVGRRLVPINGRLPKRIPASTKKHLAGPRGGAENPCERGAGADRKARRGPAAPLQATDGLPGKRMGVSEPVRPAGEHHVVMGASPS
jgi:hypothetical protein